MRQETHEALAVLLEDFSQREEPPEVEEVADAILVQLAQFGDDLLDHLDPPVGLRRWLESHGLSLIATREVTPPRVWQTIEDEEEVSQAVEAKSLGIDVGDRVSYQTAVRGPRAESQLGSGVVSAIRKVNSDVVITVQVGGERYDLIHLNPTEGDVIRSYGHGP